MLASMEDQIGRLTGQFTALKTMADSSDYFTSEESAAFSERFNQLTSAGAGVMIAIDQNIKTPQARAFLTDKARNFS